MVKRTSKEKVYYYWSNYYRNKPCKNNKAINENELIEIINEKFNLTNITGLELENKLKCIYIDKDKNVEIDFKWKNLIERIVTYGQWKFTNN